MIAGPRNNELPSGARYFVVASLVVIAPARCDPVYARVLRGRASGTVQPVS